MSGHKEQEEEMKRQLNNAYIENKLSGIIEPLVANMLREQPANNIDFMIKYLKNHYGNRPSINANERLELNFLREEVRKLKIMAGEDEHAESHSSGSERESSDEEEDIADLPDASQPAQMAAAGRRGPRTSVSAEVFGAWNKKVDFKPPKYEKSTALRESLKKRLEQAFMFSSLNPEELSIVLDAMQNIKKKAGDLVIKEGDEGDSLYVVESGVLTCTKIFKGQTEPTFLKEYQPGEAFGELALLYNAPRAATITAKTDAELWQLDRQTFNHIVKDAASKKREKYEEFLKGVKILQNMDEYERAKLADAFHEEWFQPEQVVIKEGEVEGNTFFLVMSGESIATKTTEVGKPPVIVYRYGPGDYFGERALIKNEPRAANIIAKTQLQVVTLDRQSFKRLLGPIEEILKRNIGLYQQYY